MNYDYYTIDEDKLINTTAVSNIDTTINSNYITSVDLTKKFVDQEGLEKIAEIVNKRINDINKRLSALETTEKSSFTVLRGYNYEG